MSGQMATGKMDPAAMSRMHERMKGIELKMKDMGSNGM
jgi:hypothetical protein